MSNTELLEELGKLRRQVAQMNAESRTDREYFDGIAALRNVADELLAAAEALVVIQQQASRQLAEPPHDDQAMLTIIATFADAALDALAKKLEAAS